MNPIGIALAFTLFWAAIGLGLFLTFSGAIGLGKVRRAYGIAAQHHGSQLVGSFVNAAILVVGLALVAAGAYANYAVLYR